MTPRLHFRHVGRRTCPLMSTPALSSTLTPHTRVGHPCAHHSRTLTQSLAQYVLIYSASRAASGQLSVDHNGRQTAEAVLFGTAGDLVLMHVIDVDFVLR